MGQSFSINRQTFEYLVNTIFMHILSKWLCSGKKGELRWKKILSEIGRKLNFFFGPSHHVMPHAYVRQFCRPSTFRTTREDLLQDRPLSPTTCSFIPSQINQYTSQEKKSRKATQLEVWKFFFSFGFSQISSWLVAGNFELRFFLLTYSPRNSLITLV